MTRAIIFDLDDTIVNSSPMHFNAYEKALKHFGIAAPKIPEKLRRDIYGMRIKEIMALLSGHFNLKVNLDELILYRNKYFMELVKGGIDPIPGLFELVANIKKWGLKAALATSGVNEYVFEIVRQLRLADFFGAIVTGDDVENPKPAPDCFLMAAKALNVPPSSCAVVEDADKGIEAAKKAGMLAIAIQGDSGQSLKLADFVINRLDEITLEMLRIAR